eukprot:7352160-Pyramimonas_sp.AAC.1
MFVATRRLGWPFGISGVFGGLLGRGNLEPSPVILNHSGGHMGFPGDACEGGPQVVDKSSKTSQGNRGDH